MSISVVVPNYNHAAYLARSLRSILAQGVRPDQIIVVDDKSTDDSIGVVERFARCHRGIELVRHETNRGAPAALNTGLRHARGEFVALIGADDLVLPGLFGKMIAALERHPQAALACGEVALLGPDMRILGFRPFALPAWRACFISPEAVVRLAERSDNWIVGTATVYRSKALKAIGGFDEALSSFCDGMAVRQLAFAHGFCFVPEVLGVWRRVPHSYSATTALSAEENARVLERTLDRLGHALGPKLAAAYRAPFTRRWQFGSAQSVLFWEDGAADVSRLVAAMAGSGLDRRVFERLRTVAGHRRFGRALSLAWIAHRTQPMTRKAMLANALRAALLAPLRKRRVHRELEGIALCQAANTGEIAAATSRRRVVVAKCDC